MKRRVCFVMVFSVFLVLCGISLEVGAKSSVIGYTSPSDIQTAIDCEYIPSCNIKGNTAVMVEDLAYYGFDVTWDDTTRTLYVAYNKEKRLWPLNNIDDPRAWQSEKYFMFPSAIYASDVKVILSGTETPTFNIGGYSCIYVDSLAQYGKVLWDGENRWIEVLRLDNKYPFKVKEEVRRALRRTGVMIYEKEIWPTFYDTYKLTEISPVEADRYIDYAYFSTPFCNAIFDYYSMAQQQESQLSYDLNKWLDYQTAGQYLTLDLGLKSTNKEFFENILDKFIFAVKQGDVYFRSVEGYDHLDVSGPDLLGMYSKEITILFRTQNAIDYNKPAQFVVSPFTKFPEATITVNFSKYE